MIAAPNAAAPEVTKADVLPIEAAPFTKMNQVPVDSRIAFVDTSGKDLLHVAVTRSNPPPGLAANTEYWSRLDPVPTARLKMISSFFNNYPDSPTYAAEVAAWLTGGRVVATPQVAPAHQWVQGIRTPASSSSVLFMAKDPDSTTPSRPMGLLIERGNAGEMVSLTWYKTQRPANGLIFQSPPAELTFDVVRNHTGRPVTSPMDIDPTYTWYYYHCAMTPVVLPASTL